MMGEKKKPRFYVTTASLPFAVNLEAPFSPESLSTLLPSPPLFPSFLFSLFRFFFSLPPPAPQSTNQAFSANRTTSHHQSSITQ